jgi:hypothetical protein
MFGLTTKKEMHKKLEDLRDELTVVVEKQKQKHTVTLIDGREVVFESNGYKPSSSGDWLSFRNEGDIVGFISTKEITFLKSEDID